MRKCLVKGRNGYVLMLVAAVIPLLMAVAGLALDVGLLEYHKRCAQIAADSGATGGARELQANTGASSAVAAATQDVAANGFKNGQQGASVTVNLPPASGPHLGDSRYIEVIVARQVPTSFMRMLKVSSATVRARAVGGRGDSIYCLLALDPAAQGALTLKGNTTVSTPSCAVMVDSNNSQAMTIGNSSCITASEIDVFGGYTSGGCVPVPAPNTGVPPLSDPFASLPAPSFSGCNFTNFKTTKSTTLDPGVYCGGITVSGSGNTLTFNSGIYILNGGGMKVSGGNTLEGQRLTFYNTATAGQTYSDIAITGNPHLNLSAPTSGTYESILFFQDRNFATTSTSGDSITGDNTSTLDGVIYVPKGLVTYTGNSSVNGYTNIVAKTITFSGNSTFNSNYAQLADGAPIKSGAMME